MAEKIIKGVMTVDGLAVVDYESLANLPTIDVEPTLGSTNAVQSDGVYNALSKKLDASDGKAADSILFGGQAPEYYAKADHSHSAGEIAGGVLSVAKGGTGAATAEEALKNLGAMPISGGLCTGGILFPNNGGVVFSSNGDGTTAEGTYVVIGIDERGFYINRFVDGVWMEDILKVDWTTGEVIDSKLMPKSGGKFTGNITFAEGAGIVDANGQSLAEALTYLTTTLESTKATANAAMPKANFKFDATTGTLDITL